jgi:hypothetical protein
MPSPATLQTLSSSEEMARVRMEGKAKKPKLV